MNIKITHSWLLEYLDTDATPEEIQKYLSLCGPSVERIDKVNGDYIYDIEITSNRVDSASVMGIAREASAILPLFGKKAIFKNHNFQHPSLTVNALKLTVEDKAGLNKRIMAVIFDGVQIGSSPPLIKGRLEAIGIRSINNVVDITNYVMVEVGHPMHVFDYDRVKTGKFIFRLANEGEKLVTLDDKTFTLKGGEIIIDDGTGRIIDLPSIMGTENSVVTDNSKRVILFIDNIDPILVRKASMTHGIRTVAATYNEKSVDPELAKMAMDLGIELFSNNTKPKSISKLLDIYTEKPSAKAIKINLDFINNRIGVQIEKEKVKSILLNLQFKIAEEKTTFTATPPSFRSKDVQIPEDIVEEIARVHGYHNLPNNIQSTIYIKQPREIDLLFELQAKIKHFLKHLGLHEVMNYSMISEAMIKGGDLKIEEHLKLKNTISEEIKYMRSHILHSLYMNIRNNEGKADRLKFFEIAKTYKKRRRDLPIEEYKVGIVVNTSFSDLKGIVDSLLQELNISEFDLRKTNYEYLAKNLQVEIIKGDHYIARIGQISKKYQANFEIKKDTFAAVLDFMTLIKYYKPIARYQPISQFAVIKLDRTFENKSYEEVQKKAFNSKLLQKLEVVSVFKNKLTLRFYFGASVKNITEEEAKKELSGLSL